MSMKNFQILTKLGEGAFSVVYKVKRISDGLEYALKKVKMGTLSLKEKEGAVNEVRILASISHPNIVAYKEAFFEDTTSSLCIVMEYAEGGDLLAKINFHKRNRTHFPEPEIWKMFIQMVSGLYCLHNLKILHRDVKCANMFMTKDGTIKLGDLNVSKVAKVGLLHTQTGTPYYASPEVWQDKPYDMKSDIWSLGCVLFEAVALHPPFQATNMQGLFKRVVAGIYPSIPAVYSAELSTMIKSLIIVNPRHRPTCEQIFKMPSVVKRLPEDETLASINQAMAEGGILGTIILPRNLNILSSRLPKPKYEMVRNPSLPSLRKIGSSQDSREPLGLGKLALLSKERPPSTQGELEERKHSSRLAGQDGPRPLVLRNVKNDIMGSYEKNLPELDAPREYVSPYPRRNASVDGSIRKEDATRRLIEYYRAHPIRQYPKPKLPPGPGKEKTKPPLQLKNDKPAPVPYYYSPKGGIQYRELDALWWNHQICILLGESNFIQYYYFYQFYKINNNIFGAIKQYKEFIRNCKNMINY